MFDEQENYIMRFQAALPYYAYDGGSTTIIYFRKGNGDFVDGKVKTSICDNRFIIANPHSDWEYINHTKTDIDVLSFVLSHDVVDKINFFTGATLNSLLETPFNSSKNGFFFSRQAFNANYYKTGSLLKNLYAYSNTSEYELACPQEVAMTVLGAVYAEQAKGYDMAEKVIGNKKTTKVEVMKRLLVSYEYIQDNIAKRISIQELSKVAGLSEFHLFKSFKKVFGKTPHQYITTQKMRRAQELLRGGEFTSSQVAFLLNYPDLPTFSKVYKKTFGISPSLVVT